MKSIFLLLCVVAAAFAAKNQDAFLSLFDNLAQELGQYLGTKYNDQHIVSQADCQHDCTNHFPLGPEMCKVVCHEAGIKFSHVSST